MEDLISKLLESMDSEEPDSSEKTAEAAEETGEDQDYSSLLDFFGSDEGDNPSEAAENPVQSTLSMLFGILGDEKGALPTEKVNLIKAMKPYAGGRAESIDRAITLAETAKKARSLLSRFGK